MQPPVIHTGTAFAYHHDRDRGPLTLSLSPKGRGRGEGEIRSIGKKIIASVLMINGIKG